MKKNLFPLIGLWLLGLTATAQTSIDLSGIWNFQTDREEVGEREKWYNRKELDDTIELPGSMPERLKGDKPTIHTQWTGTLYDSSFYYNPYMEKFRQEEDTKFPFFLTPDRHYKGVAWYNREVTIPKTWRNKRIVLTLERPHIETTVWVNGKLVGMQNSLCVAHEYDLTPYLTPGKSLISVRVDNRIKEINVGPESHSVSDQTQGNWNGIVGRMALDATSPLFIEDQQIYPDVEQKQAKVSLTICGKKNQKVCIRMAATSFNSPRHHAVPAVEKAITLPEDTFQTELILPMGDDVLLWDEFTPNLYRLKTEITSGKEKDTQESQFGMRSFTIDGKWFYVNGRQTMLRGTVECCLFPNTGYPPTDVESWERIYRICKKYGLNHMRFHSYCPPEAAFIAADLVGFYLQAEGPSWPNHGPRLGRGEPIDKYLMDETIRMTRHYGNHPSFCMLAAGNEPSGNWVKWTGDFVDFWKANDSRRVYTGASVGNSWQWQPRSQFHVKAGARGLTWSKSRPATNDDYRLQNRIDTVRQPYVAHENGQWCVFPNFQEIKKYHGVNKAKNFELFREHLKDQHMGELGHDFLMASGKLQALCYKYEIEKTLRTPDYAGFQLLALNDYSGQGSAIVGVLDVFFEEKGYIDASAWKRFCAPTVPLMRTDKFVYETGDTLKAEIEVAHFGPHPLNNVAVTYTIKDAQGRILTEQTLQSEADINIGNCQPLGSIRFVPQENGKPQQLNLEVKIEGTGAANDWNFWVYPKEQTMVQGDVYITDTLDDKAIELLDKGGKVLITAAGKVSYGKDVVQHFLPVFWNTSWFKMRPPHTTGFLVDHKHPLFNNFPTDYHSDIQWWELVNRTQVMQLDHFPKDFQPTIQSIDTWFVNRKIGMLFEANVLNGKLLMTSIDIDTNLTRRIVARQLRNSILNYMNSDKFRPTYEISPEQVNAIFTQTARKVDSFTKDSPDELKPVRK